MKFEIDVDVDQIDNMTAEVLKGYHKDCIQTVDYVSSLEDPPEYQLEDLKYSKKMAKHLKKVIKYMSTPSDYKLWKKGLE